MKYYFKKILTKIPGVYILKKKKFKDKRGLFIKTFNKDFFINLKLSTRFVESVYSISKKNVLRGMHFQKFPHDHIKLVNVIKGDILDVVVCIDKKNKFFGKYIAVRLSEKNNKSLYIPKGFAHGFLCLSKIAIVGYKTTTVYNPKFDTGIKYDSFGFKWPIKKIIISSKDKNLKNLIK